MQVMLDALGLKPRTGSCIKFCAFAAEFQIDLVDIFHQIQGLFLADVLIERAAKIVGNIVFTIRESAGAAKAAHNAAAFAVDTGLDFVTVDGAFPLFQGMARLKNSYAQLGILLHQFIGRKNTARTCAHNNHIVFHLLVCLPCSIGIG